MREYFSNNLMISTYAPHPPALMLCQTSRYLTAKQFIIQTAYIYIYTYLGRGADGRKLYVMTYARTQRTARETLKIWIFFL